MHTTKTKMKLEGRFIDEKNVYENRSNRQKIGALIIIILCRKYQEHEE